MIQRIIDPEEFKKATNDIFDLLNVDAEENTWHYLIPNNRKSFIDAFAHKALLSFDVFAWANLNDQGKYDAAIVFIKQRSERYGVDIFCEHTWLSGNPKVGFKLFATALKFARDNNYEYICVSRSLKSPNADNVERFYNKMGFIKDTETYIAKL